jgi:hypothetical protein
LAKILCRRWIERQTLPANHGVSGIGLKEGLLGYFGAQDNFNRLSYSAVQRLQGRKKADPSSGRYGEYLDRQD